MTNRRTRRAQRRSGPRPSGSASNRRAGLRLLVIVAVVGLVLLALASTSAITVAPTASPPL